MENKQIIQQMLALLKQLDYKETSKDESLMKNLVEMSCDRYWLYNPITKVMQIIITNNKDKENATRTRLLTDLLKHVSSDDQAKINKVFYNLEKQKTTEEDFEYCSDNGNVAIAYEVVTRSFIVDDELRIIGITRILGEAQKTIDYIIQAQKKFDLLMGLSSMYIWEYDILNKQFCANESLSNKLGIEERVYSLKELLEHIKIQELALFKEQIQKQKPMDNSVLHINILKNSYESIFETNYRPILNKHGDYVMLLGTLNDITEKELLKTMASKDKLTGCYNRSMADVKLESTFTSFKENDDFYTVIFFDIDKFKQINDRYGHDAGDFALCEICRELTKEIRSNDMMFRWGGDEFLLICSGIVKANMYGYVDRLRKIIEYKTFEYNGNKLNFTISIGAASYYHSDTSAQDAMKRADRSLYKAKIAGRNKVCILK